MATTLFFGLVVSACGELESDTLLQSKKVSSSKQGEHPGLLPLLWPGAHCLKIETDSGYYADGELTLAVDSGDGMVEELSDYYKQGSTVIKKCYQDVVAVEVSAGTNGWIGSILYSDNGGQSYSAMSCPTCSNGHSTAFIIVDGDTDASIIPNRIMCVDVLSNGPCRLEKTTTTTTAVVPTTSTWHEVTQQGRCLGYDVHGDLYHYKCDGQDSQLWQIEDAIIVSKGRPGECLVNDGGRGWPKFKSCDASNEHQRWAVSAAGQIKNGEVCIKEGWPGQNNRLRVLPCTGATNEFWEWSVFPQACLPPSASTQDVGYTDAYQGWYDVQGCGKCNDYCRWVGNSYSGGNPAAKLAHGTSWWSCRLAGSSEPYSSKGHFASWNFAKCSGQGEGSPQAMTTTTTTAILVGDTPGWNCGRRYRYSCSDYESKGFCKNGAFVLGQECSGGDKNNYPEKNCVVCGKGAATHDNRLQHPGMLVIDTPGWNNANKGRSYSCSDYESNGWCKSKAFVLGNEWTGGATYNYPEQNCVVCGKSEATDTCLQNLLPDGDGCSQANKCGVCQGDCDKDSHCLPGLKCFQRDTSPVPVPGCVSGGFGDGWTYDYCYDPSNR